MIQLVQFIYQVMRDEGDVDDELRVKQREVQQLQESRYQRLLDVKVQLEKQLEDQKIKLRILSEDFSYNLELLEARKLELQRQDRLIQEISLEKDQAYARVKSLLAKIEHLEAKEEERKAVEAEERARNKVVICFHSYNFMEL